ncbi:MAG: DASS family sodium-coupled anion symporter [Candidatus Micrarchaeota archaeon]
MGNGRFRWRYALLAALLAALSLLPELPLTMQGRAVLAITLFTGTMWFSEAAPLHVTALLSTVLLILSGQVSAGSAFSPYFSPTIVLFFGGFMIARAMQRHGLDRQIALAFSSRFGSEPSMYLLGLMAATAFLSLWISNTAATAMMLPIALIAVTRSKLKPLQSNYAKAVVLGIAFASTIGGIGTIVGTPPNGITVADLAKAGIGVSFLEWMYYGMPFVLLFLPLSWFILMRVYPPEIKKVALEQKAPAWSKEHGLVLLVMGLAVAAWVTSFAHGVPDAAVGVGAVVLLYAFGLLETEDASKIDWATLLLFGGGLSLGTAIDASGLGAYLGGLLGALVAGQGLPVIYLAVLAFAVLMTLSASNTATAALLVPVMIPLAGAVGAGVKGLAILAGIGTSLDFIVPVGTPPSAIAYSSGYVSVKDMARAGLWITLAGMLLLAGLALLYW